jgi:hypothetical protein
MTWTSYDKRTGRVLGKHSARIPDAMLRGDMAIIECDVPTGYFVDPDTLQPRQCGALEYVVDGNSITGLPDDCEIIRDGAVLARGNVTFGAEWEQSIRIAMQSPRHRPVTLTLHLQPGDGDVRIEQDVRQLRARAYPDVRDQLDALWKGGSAAEEMKTRVAGVKARFPKNGKE